jgi:hypothetical protein
VKRVSGTSLTDAQSDHLPRAALAQQPGAQAPISARVAASNNNRAASRSVHSVATSFAARRSSDDVVRPVHRTRAQATTTNDAGLQVRKRAV